jgi:phage-related protein
LAYSALNFTFNGISSENLGVKLVNFDSSGLVNSPYTGNDTPVTEQIRRRHKVYLYGVQPAPPLEFELQFASEDELDFYSLEAISMNLFGKQEYGWLQIEQPSYEGLFFECLLLDPQLISIGNANYGYKCKCQLSSSYCYTDEYPYTYNINVPNQIINFNNLSNYDGYVFPYLTITTGIGTTSFSIKNINDNNRLFSFENIQENETITVDNDLQIITSSKGINRLNNFNFKFFRLVRGNNQLVVNGNGELKFKIRFIKKIGG